jgi:hypothetical protein
MWMQRENINLSTKSWKGNPLGGLWFHLRQSDNFQLIPHLTPSWPPPSRLLISNSLNLYPHCVPAQMLHSPPYTDTFPLSSPQNLTKTHSALISSPHSAPLSTRTHPPPPNRTANSVSQSRLTLRMWVYLNSSKLCVCYSEQGFHISKVLWISLLWRFVWRSINLYMVVQSIMKIKEW